jgi:hypothetical protein
MSNVQQGISNFQVNVNGNVNVNVNGNNNVKSDQA